MRNSKQEQRIRLTEWIANLVGTAPPLLEGLWNNISTEEISDVQGDLFYRAYEIISHIENGEINELGIAKYLYGHSIFQRYPKILDSAIEYILPSVKNMISVVMHQIKYAESPILVPPIIEQQLLVAPEIVRKKCIAYLVKRGIDPEAYVEMLRERIGSEENPNPKDPMFLNKIFDKNTMDNVAKEVLKDIRNMVK